MVRSVHENFKKQIKGVPLIFSNVLNSRTFHQINAKSFLLWIHPTRLADRFFSTLSRIHQKRRQAFPQIYRKHSLHWERWVDWTDLNLWVIAFDSTAPQTQSDDFNWSWYFNQISLFVKKYIQNSINYRSTREHQHNSCSLDLHFCLYP